MTRGDVFQFWLGAAPKLPKLREHDLAQSGSSQLTGGLQEEIGNCSMARVKRSSHSTIQGIDCLPHKTLINNHSPRMESGRGTGQF